MERLENDMDDLFRKAGEQYPLKISESDWDSVAGKLQEESFGDQSTLTSLNAIGKRNKRRWRVLLLLIPLGLTGLVYTSRLSSKRHAIPAPVVVKNNAVPVISKKINPVNPAGPDKLIKDDNNQTSVDEVVKPNEPLSRETHELSEYTASLSSQHKKVLNSKNGRAKFFIPGGNRQSKNNFDSKNDNHPIAADNFSKLNNPIGDPSPYNEEAFRIQLEKPLTLTTVSDSNLGISVHGIPFPVASLQTTTPFENKKSNPVTSSSKGIYIGLLAGPDFSAVKFQSVNRTGFSLGISAGYRFSKRLAVETGLIWDKKYYYSKGEYFNKSSANIPAYVNIVNLDGNCNMFEIPVAIRYDFISRQNHGFFGKAGLSTYLMKKENYSYLADYGGVQTMHNATYDNGLQNNIFSIVQLSAGYELAISRKTKIRFEPYVKIPLQGVGVGSMPISSAGLYLGISHSFR
jgi:hypothetical protein